LCTADKLQGSWELRTGRSVITVSSPLVTSVCAFRHKSEPPAKPGRINFLIKSVTYEEERMNSTVTGKSAELERVAQANENGAA